MIDLHDGSEKSEAVLKDCNLIMSDILDNKHSLRECTKETLIPKSTIHEYIHEYIRTIDPDSYVRIMKILKHNSRYARCLNKGFRYR